MPLAQLVAPLMRVACSCRSLMHRQLEARKMRAPPSLPPPPASCKQPTILLNTVLRPTKRWFLCAFQTAGRRLLYARPAGRLAAFLSTICLFQRALNKGAHCQPCCAQLTARFVVPSCCRAAPTPRPARGAARRAPPTPLALLASSTTRRSPRWRCCWRLTSCTLTTPGTGCRR